MHIQICIEDASGKILLENLMPKIVRNDVSYSVHGYRGIGSLPKNLKPTDDAQKRIILENIPKLIRGCANTPYITALIFIFDTDMRDCREFLASLKDLHQAVAPEANVIFRLAIEEGEAWLLGDRQAILEAYPNADVGLLNRYVQDSVCGTWEVLADAIETSKASGLKAKGWPAPGEAKCRWADEIGRRMVPERNSSPSFQKLLQALAPFT